MRLFLLALLCSTTATANAARPDSPGTTAVFKFDPDDVVESYGAPEGRVLVHFTRDGDNGVRPTDNDQSGVPDEVEVVAETYEEVLSFYEEQGFRLPESDEGTSDNGGDGRFDVYLVDFGLAADGNYAAERCKTSPDTCSGYMVQENDFAGYGYPSFRYATRVLASHETFHAIQAAYDAQQGSNIAEATAVWATEQFDPTLSDFEGFVDGWLEETERSLDEDPIGPVAAYAYGMSIVVQYFSESIGPELVRELWEGCVDGANDVADPHWLDVLARLLEAHDTTFAEAMVELASWTLRSGYDDQPVGSTWAHAGAFPTVESEQVALPYTEDKLRVFRASLQTYTLSPAGRDTVRVELVTPDAAELEGMRLVVSARDNLTITTTPDSDHVVTVPATGIDQIVVAVVNTQTAGDSQRPGLCIGSPDEVEACRATIIPVVEPEPEPVLEPSPEPEPEPTVEATPDADPETAAETTTKKKDDGCSSAPSAPPLALALALAFTLARAFRRLSATATRARRAPYRSSSR